MAEGSPFGLKELLEAIEQRLPFGKFITRVVLAVAVVWFMVSAGGAIYDGAIRPVARHLSTGQLPQVDWSRLLPAAVPTAVLALVFAVVLLTLSRIAKRLTRLETQATQKAVIETVTHRTTDQSQHVAYRALVQLRETAIQTLLNRNVNNEDELNALKQEIDDWQNSVSSLLVVAGADPVSISSFRVLGVFPQALNGWNADHRKERNMLAERLRRLEETLRHIQEEINRKAIAGFQAARP